MDKMFWSEEWDVHDDYAWAFDSQYNILAKIDIDKSEIVCVDSIPYYSSNDNRDFSCIYELNGEVYLLPDKADDMYIYNIEGKKWRSINIPHSISLGRIRAVWCGHYKEKLLVYAAYLKTIIYFDYKNKRIDECVSLNSNSNEVLADRDIVMEGDTLFFYGEKSLKLYSYNLKNRKIIEYEVSNNSGGCRAMLKSESRVWIYGGEKKLYCYNIDSGRIEQTIEIPFRYATSKDEDDCNRTIVTGFSGLIESFNKIWLIPCRADMIYVVDELTGEVKPFVMDEAVYYGNNISESPLGSQFSINYYRNKRYIGLYSFSSQSCIEIDTKYQTWKYVEYKISGLECYKKSYRKKAVEKENGFMNLEMYLNRLIG